MKYFYFDAASRSGIQAESAVEGDAEEITATWDTLPRVPGSFFGIYSSTGAVVQFRWNDLNSITIDLPFPSRGGSMAKQSSFEECNAVIANVCTGSDPEGIPGLDFVKW